MRVCSMDRQGSITTNISSVCNTVVEQTVLGRIQLGRMETKGRNIPLASEWQQDKIPNGRRLPVNRNLLLIFLRCWCQTVPVHFRATSVDDWTIFAQSISDSSQSEICRYVLIRMRQGSSGRSKASIKSYKLSWRGIYAFKDLEIHRLYVKKIN